MKTKKFFLKKAILATVIVGTTGMWFLQSGKNLIQLPTTTATKIVDGDTFWVKENQVIRLAYANAPEIDRCGGIEAKKALELILKDKQIYYKVNFRDQFYRLISQAYTINGSVDEAMLKSGWAYYEGRTDVPKGIADAAAKAKSKKVGIYSEKCTQTKNPDKPNCLIKGNNRAESNDKLYRFPGCGQYNNTYIQLFMGDQWFCGEKEAIKAGYSKGSDCFKKMWPVPNSSKI